jgi:hypothetical protein
MKPHMRKVGCGVTLAALLFVVGRMWWALIATSQKPNNYLPIVATTAARRLCAGGAPKRGISAMARLRRRAELAPA